jgi:hypothetical protein
VAEVPEVPEGKAVQPTVVAVAVGKAVQPMVVAVRKAVHPTVESVGKAVQPTLAAVQPAVAAARFSLLALRFSRLALRTAQNDMDPMRIDPTRKDPTRTAFLPATRKVARTMTHRKDQVAVAAVKTSHEAPLSLPSWSIVEQKAGQGLLSRELQRPPSPPLLLPPPPRPDSLPLLLLLLISLRPLLVDSRPSLSSSLFSSPFSSPFSSSFSSSSSYPSQKSLNRNRRRPIQLCPELRTSPLAASLRHFSVQKAVIASAAPIPDSGTHQHFWPQP